MIVSVLVFGSTRFSQMVQRLKTQTQITVLEDYYDMNFKYDGGEQIHIALAIYDD